MRDATFVQHVEAATPVAAAQEARLWAAPTLQESDGDSEGPMPKDELAQEADSIEIIAVFVGSLADQYDPAQGE